MTQPVDIAGLRALVERATPGEWRTGEMSRRCKQDHRHDVRGCNYEPDGWMVDNDYDRVVSTADGRTLIGWNDYGPSLESHADAAFIAAARTALPALCDRVEELEADLDAARKLSEAAQQAFAKVALAADEGMRKLREENARLRAEVAMWRDAYHEANVDLLRTRWDGKSDGEGGVG